MSEPTRPPVAEARDVVARAMMDAAPALFDAFYVDVMADAVLLALRQSAPRGYPLAPATAPETEGIVVDVYGSSNMTPEQKAMLGEAVKRLFDAEDERERMIRAAFDAFYAEGTPYTESERAIFGQVVDAVLRRIAPATAPAGTLSDGELWSLIRKRLMRFEDGSTESIAIADATASAIADDVIAHTPYADAPLMAFDRDGNARIAGEIQER